MGGVTLNKENGKNMSFWDTVSKGVNVLVSNVDKIAIGYAGILKQRANVSLAKSQAQTQLAELQAQAADSKAQAAIANATATAARANPTATGIFSQLKSSPVLVLAIGVAVVGGLYLFKQGKA